MFIKFFLSLFIKCYRRAYDNYDFIGVKYYIDFINRINFFLYGGLFIVFIFIYYYSINPFSFRTLRVIESNASQLGNFFLVLEPRSF